MATFNCMYCGKEFRCNPDGLTAARRSCGNHSAEEVAIVHRALTETVVCMGQLSKTERKALDKCVKLGILSKGKGGAYPILKTVYAVPEFDFAADREEGVAEMMRAHMFDLARGTAHHFPMVRFQ